jgi:hypothetical protein
MKYSWYQIFCWRNRNQELILRKLERIERKLNILGEIEMATADEIITKVTEQTSIIESVRVLVEQLQAAADDPAKLQEIVNALDTNNAALAVLANTPVPA